MISIDEDARKKFESDWLDGRSLSIKNYLPADDSETYLGTLEELVCIDLEFRWRQKHEGGSTSEATVSVDEAAAPTLVEDYLLEFPELGKPDILKRLVEQEIYVRASSGYVVEPSEYRSRFPAIKVDESLFSGGDAQGTIVQSPSLGSAIAEFPLQFGSYLLTSLLGRGGMGAVYRARQPAANREVAVKIADVSTLNSVVRQQVCQRFETEARAAAALVHDNVVPIFDVGIIEEQPFYAMRLVEGGDLGAMSKAEPLEPKRAARYMLGITRGIAEAHRLGMLHRDIKPQNILVDAATDRAMITDFGLARFVEDDSGMTQTGQVLGTPSFMAPEQIKDSSGIDARAEIYSLGATLYQLLTGRPPFKAASMQETLRQVLSEDPLPPRRLNSAIDRDLDTICLKCLEKEPEARYQRADELAAELERFIDGKPIQARPAGPGKRLWKWCRRNPQLASALGLAALMAIAAFVAILAIVDVQRKSIEDKQLTFQDAFGAVSDLIRSLLEEPTFASPGIEPARNDVLRESLGYYEHLISVNQDDPSMQSEVAVAMSALGNTGIELKEPAEQSERYLLDALDTISKLPDAARKSKRILQAHSDALIGLGVIAREGDDLQKARQFFADAAAVRRQWTELFPNDLEGKRKLANALMNEGLIVRKQGELFDAELLQIKAQQIRVDLVASGQTSLKLKRDMANAEFNLAMLELHLENRPQVLQRLQAARKQYEELAQEAQVDSQLWQQYANARLREAHFFADRPDDPEADRLRSTTMINEALSDLNALFRLSSGQPNYQLQLLELYQYGIDSLISQNNMQLVNEHVAQFANMQLAFEESIAGMTDVNKRALTTMRLQAAKHRAILALGMDADDAIDKLEEAVDLFDEHADTVSSNPLLADDAKRLNAILNHLLGGGL